MCSFFLSYNFVPTSDDESRLFVDHVFVTENGEIPSMTEGTVALDLEVGLVAVWLDCLQVGASGMVFS